MPSLLSEWRDRIQKAVHEYGVAREALDRVKAQMASNANALLQPLSLHFSQADRNLEGTYIIRVFAVFDAALRSYDRHHFKNPNQTKAASRMIDQLGALLKVHESIREGVHRARRVRNYWLMSLSKTQGPSPSNASED